MQYDYFAYFFFEKLFTLNLRTILHYTYGLGWFWLSAANIGTGFVLES